MTAVDPHPKPSAEGAAPAPGPAHAAEHAAPSPVPVEDRFASPVPVANPALVGVPTFMVGSIALGLQFVGYVPQAVAGAPIAIIATATSIGQFIACLFALRAGESAVASVFGIFGGFWISYAALVFGLVHNWYGFPPTEAVSVIKTFVLSWLILIVILTLVSLRLPSGFTVLFVFVDIALLFTLLSYVNASAAGVASSGMLKIAGVFVFAFIAVGAYLFADAMSVATGGRNLPLGPPLLK